MANNETGWEYDPKTKTYRGPVGVEAHGHTVGSGVVVPPSSITSSMIVDSTIVTADLADSSVTSAKIVDGTIATADIADGQITAAKRAVTPYARVRQTVAQLFGSGDQTVVFNVESLDTDNMVTPVLSAISRITMNTAGFYVVTGSFRWVYDAGGSERYLSIWKNGDSAQRLASQNQFQTSGAGHNNSVAGGDYFAVNDYIIMAVYHNSGVNINSDVNFGTIQMTAAWISP